MLKTEFKAHGPWRCEHLHADDYHPRLKKERGAAGQRRLRLCYAAALDASSRKAAQAVAERLRACAPNNRCGSGACPSCTWATNRWFRKQAAAFAEGASQMLFSVVQLPDWRALPNDLNEVDIAQQKVLLSDALVAAGLEVAPIIGAADFRLSVWPAENSKRWSIHWALYTPDRDATSFTKALTCTMAPHPLVEVPVKTKVISKTPDKVYSYGFKSVFDRKTLPHGQFGRDDIIRPRDAEFVPMAIALDRIGIMGRFFTQACHLSLDADLWRAF